MTKTIQLHLQKSASPGRFHCCGGSEMGDHDKQEFEYGGILMKWKGPKNGQLDSPPTITYGRIYNVSSDNYIISIEGNPKKRNIIITCINTPNPSERKYYTTNGLYAYSLL